MLEQVHVLANNLLDNDNREIDYAEKSASFFALAASLVPSRCLGLVLT